MTKEVPDWQALRAFANFNKLGPKRVYKKLQKDSLYSETRKKHSEDSKILAVELKPMFQFAEELGGILGVDPTMKKQSEISGTVNTDSNLDEAKMFSFIECKLVDPDFIIYTNLLIQRGLISSTPENAHPIIMQRMEQRYVALFEDWTEKLIEILAR